MKLLIGGSPCTHWSIAQTKNRETEPSGIGWELFENYLIALEKFKPDFFLYENNKSMSKAIRDEITKRLGVEPICINSTLVSAQNRQRLYWTNIPGVQLPEDRGILLRDILETGIAWQEKAYNLTTRCQGAIIEDTIKRHRHTMVAEPVNVTADGKAQCLQATHYKDGIRNMVGNEVDQKTCVAEPVFELVEYKVPNGMTILSTDDRMRSANEKGSRQGSYVYFPNAVKTNTLLASHAEHEKVMVPIRIGTIENEAKNQEPHDSQQYRVYSPDGESITLCGQGGGIGAKTGLYAVPCVGRIVGRRINEQGHRDDYNENIPHIQRFEINENPQKTNCLTTVQKDNMVIEAADGKTFPIYKVQNGLITIKGKQYPIKSVDGYYIIRKLTVRECMRLQTVPEWYEFPVSNTQAYKMLGNGWTVDVIAHILPYCPGIKTEPLDVLSMYDGMACGHIALDKLEANIKRYRATEIDKYAIQTACHNFPDIEQIGDAFQVREW